MKDDWVPDDSGTTIARAIGEAIGGPFELTSTEPVSGGCIHTALKVSGETNAGKKKFFAKVNAPDRAAMFKSEAEGLQALGAAGAVRVPAVVAQGADDEQGWLILEWLDLAPLSTQSGAKLGEALAAQHRIPQAKFGWARDNFIGSSPQVNGWSDDWLDFWREKRLLSQLRLAAHHRLPSRMIDRGERLVADCAAFFSNYRPAKSLLHGDLWGGNAAAMPGTQMNTDKSTQMNADEGMCPVVFDPAVYVGDREADVAMTELFGGFPKEFRSAYQAAWALDGGYPVRRDLYNLYHVLNHANLFFGSYVRQSEQAIEKLLAEIA